MLTRTQTHARSTGYDHLLAPGRIGPLSLSNRVVLPAMDMNVCHDGVIAQEDIDHYVARGAGGTAMIITGASAVAFPVGATSMKEPGLSDDRFIPGLKALADALHDAGSTLCVQMTHHGKVARVDTANDRPLLVPSTPKVERNMSSLIDNTRDELVKMSSASAGKQATYHEATEEDLEWLIRMFADAAERVQKAGGDAVEIHCAHGYVLGGFLSRADNRRTDRWGGSLENRARLACEVIRAVRERVGDKLAVIVRVAGREFGEDDALTTAEAIAAAVLFEQAGAHAIHVTGWGRNPFSNFTDGPLPNKVGAYREFTAQIKKAVSVPVIAVGRVLPEVGEEMIAGGECDFVAMGRQLLADPDLVDKIAAGHPESVRPCINCYVCVQENFYDDTPLCAVNPALGAETRLPFVKTTTAKDVVVIGAGPAGLETARVATERGHRVTVLDKTDRLGGTLWFSQLTTPDNGRLLRWLTSEVTRLGIDIRLGTQATAASIAALRPDVVVVATGAVRDRPAIPGGDLPHVHTGDTLRDVMTGHSGAGTPWVLRVLGALGRLSRITRSAAAVREITKHFLPIGKDVVVIGGSLVGLELAEYLAERGRTVTLLEEGQQVGLPMAMPRRWTAVRNATEHGVTIHRNATAERITEDRVDFRVGDETMSVPATAVIVATGTHPSEKLADDLRNAGLDVRVVGDAHSVDYIEGAMHSAWGVATEL